MKKALIVYQSKTGITEKFGNEIRTYISTKNIEVQAVTVKDFKNELLDNADYLLTGCWTAGFMLLFQHPDKLWKNFAKNLSFGSCNKVALFTTYKIATGSMFKSMRKYMGLENDQKLIELKSKTGTLSGENKELIDKFLN